MSFINIYSLLLSQSSASLIWVEIVPIGNLGLFSIATGNPNSRAASILENPPDPPEFFTTNQLILYFLNKATSSCTENGGRPTK